MFAAAVTTARHPAARCISIQRSEGSLIQLAGAGLLLTVDDNRRCYYTGQVRPL